MASIIDSYREVFDDRSAFLKMFVLAIPAFFAYQSFLNNKGDLSDFYFLTGLTIFIVFGVLVKITTNVVNEKNNIWPTFNPLPIIWASIKGLISILPVTLVSCFIANYVCSFIQFSYWVDITLKTIVWLVATSMIIASFLIFSEKEKVLDGFNVKIIFEKSGDLSFAVLFFIIKFAIINLFTTVFLGYTIWVLFGFGVIFDVFASLALMFVLAVTGHYLGQMYYETIGYQSSGAR